MSSFTVHASGAQCSVCKAAVPRGRLMCPEHWRLVPKPMQLRVWRTWEDALRREGTTESRARDVAAYREAAQDATQHVTTYHGSPMAAQPVTPQPESAQ